MGGVSAKAAFTHGNAFTYTRGALITHTRDITDQVTTESCKQSNGWLVFRIWHLPLQQCCTTISYSYAGNSNPSRNVSFYQ